MIRPRRVLYDARWIGQHGIGRFAREVRARLGSVDLLCRAAPLSPAGLLGYELALLRQGRPGDVLFSPGFNAPVARRVPFAFTVHDLIHLRDERELSALKRAYYERVVRPAARAARKVFTVSEFSRQEIVDWAGVDEAQVVAVYNGVSDGLTPEGPRFEPGYPYLLYVGNRKPHKNVPRLLAAFARRADADVRLVLSGEADEATLAQLSCLRLGGAVVFAGKLEDAELAALYRGAAALVQPSTYEGFGLPPLEAMACGTPVICSNVTSLPEVVGDAALLFDPHDEDAILHAIDAVLGDAGVRAELRRRGVQQAARFSWSRTAGLIASHLGLEGGSADAAARAAS